MGMAMHMRVVERVPVPQRLPPRFPLLAQVFNVIPRSVHKVIRRL